MDRKQIKIKKGRESEMIRSAYKSQKHQQSRQKRGSKNKAGLIIVFTKMSMAHHVSDVYYLFKRKSISGCHGEHSYTETQQY
jgi:hypothetical protein